jgi:hypothetical protein
MTASSFAIRRTRVRPDHRDPGQEGTGVFGGPDLGILYAASTVRPQLPRFPSTASMYNPDVGVRGVPGFRFAG